MAHERKPSPLWQFVPARAYVPPTGPKPTDTGFVRPRRDVGEQELRPLRIDDDWRVLRILDLLPPAGDPSEALSWLLVAAAVTQGPGRVLELADKAGGLLRRAVPKLEHMVEDPAFGPHAALVRALASEGRLALEELPEVKTRASNERDVAVSRPYGLRLLDLLVLGGHVRTTVGAHELTRRPNPAGVGFGRRLFESSPDPELGETWLGRLLGSGPLRGVRLFWPRDYERLLLVFDDGRLAYDPGAGESFPGRGAPSGR